MSLSSTSRFTDVYVSYEGIIPTILAWQKDETPSLYGNIDISETLPTGDDLTNLEALQAIYASSDGFQDADDNSIAVTLEISGFGTLPTTDIDEVEEFGLVNPLIPGYEMRLRVLRDLDAMFVKEAEVAQDPLTLASGHDTQGRIHTENANATEDGSIEISMADTSALAYTSDKFIIRQVFSSDEAPMDDDVTGEKRQD